MQRLVEVSLVLRRNVYVGRCARPAVEVLVATADGEVDAMPVEGDVHDTGRVAQVPQRQRADVLGQAGEPR